MSVKPDVFGPNVRASECPDDQPSVCPDVWTYAFSAEFDTTSSAEFGAAIGAGFHVEFSAEFDAEMNDDFGVEFGAEFEAAFDMQFGAKRTNRMNESR